jgi:hypothetical protein
MVENFKFDKDNITGKCPECNFDWDKGDAFEFVKVENEEIRLIFPDDRNPTDAPKTTDEQLQKRANKRYGWTPENKVHLSHLTHLMLSDGDMDSTGDISHYQCPKCMIAWHVENGERCDKYKLLLDQHELMLRAMAGSPMNNINGNNE